MGLGNRRRTFSDAVTIEAWHRPLDGRIKNAFVHARVTFGEARVGDEPGLRLTFRLAIRKAEVILIVPESEGLGVDPASVASGTPHPPPARSQGGGLMAGLSGLFGMGSRDREDRPGPAAVGNRTIKVAKVHVEETGYRWVLEPGAGEWLEGQPWDATQEPRVRLVDPGKAGARMIEPCVRLEVRCLREDLIISDVKLIDPTLQERFKDVVGHRNKEIAAECFIRDELIRNGLEVGDISNRFARITLASVTAGQDWSGEADDL